MPENKELNKGNTAKPLFRFHKQRLLLGWIGGVFLFLNSHVTDMGFRVGVPIALAGMLWRAWASGFIERKNHQLATGGPFAHVRNPLYVGNFLIGLGIVVITQSIPTAIVFLLGFGILYYGTVRKEEKELTQRFGAPYLHYLQAVPRFLPRWSRYPDAQNTTFQWKLLWKHRELETFFAVLLVLTGLYLWEEIFWEGQFAAKEKVAIVTGLALIAALIAERCAHLHQKARIPKVLPVSPS